MTGKFLVGVSSLLFAGCATDGSARDGTSEAEQASVSTNGVSLNGVSLNGVSLNGVSLNGVSLNGVSLNGVSLNGVSLNGTTMTGVRSDTGASLTVSSVGKTLNGVLSDGSILTLRIDSAYALAGASADVWSYGVSYSTSAGWMPLCSAGALAVAGTWDGTGAYATSATTFTFACRGASVAKCVELGYDPANGYEDELASCVRLLRGDYCGTGVPYTVTGSLVNIYDAQGVQADTETNWMQEAEWSPAGARCVALAQFTRFESNGLMPACMADGTLPTTQGCGSRGFGFGAVLISETPVAMPTTSTTTKTKTSLKTMSLK